MNLNCSGRTLRAPFHWLHPIQSFRFDPCTLQRRYFSTRRKEITSSSKLSRNSARRHGSQSQHRIAQFRIFVSKDFKDVGGPRAQIML
jgi:hypothetical protein